MHFKLDTAYVPDRWYIGVNSSTGYPMANMVPDGPGFEKRKWLIDGSISDRFYITYHTNQTRYKAFRKLKPSSNFELLPIEKRGLYDSDPIIFDPVGFYIRISYNNFYYLLSKVNIHDNKILTECGWVRNRGNNILLPTDSIEYITVLNNKKR